MILAGGGDELPASNTFMTTSGSYVIIKYYVIPAFCHLTISDFRQATAPFSHRFLTSCPLPQQAEIDR